MCTCRAPSVSQSVGPLSFFFFARAQCRECNASFRYAKAALAPRARARPPAFLRSTVFGQRSAGMFYELANWVGTAVFLGGSSAHPRSLAALNSSLARSTLSTQSVRNSLVLFRRCAIIIMSSPS